MNFKHWIPLFSWTRWTSIEFHYFRGHATMISTIFWKKLLAVQCISTFLVEFKKVFQEQQQEQQQQQQQISRSS